MRGSWRREYEADCGRQSSIAEDVRLRRVAVNGSNALLVQPADGFDVQFNDRWDDALLPQQSADCLPYRSIANHHGSRTRHCPGFIFEETPSRSHHAAHKPDTHKAALEYRSHTEQQRVDRNRCNGCGDKRIACSFGQDLQLIAEGSQDKRELADLR